MIRITKNLTSSQEVKTAQAGMVLFQEYGVGLTQRVADKIIRLPSPQQQRRVLEILSLAADLLNRRTYKAVALHPVPRHPEDGVGFTKSQLIQYGHTLSNKPISIDHDGHPHEKFQKSPWRKSLPYPANKTGTFAWDPIENGLLGSIEISDAHTQFFVEMGLFQKLSVESTGPFSKLSLLSPNIEPRDPNARIIIENRRLELE